MVLAPSGLGGLNGSAEERVIVLHPSIHVHDRRSSRKAFQASEDPEEVVILLVHSFVSNEMWKTAFLPRKEEKYTLKRTRGLVLFIN